MVTDNKTNRLNSRIRMWISFLANMAKRVNKGAVVYYALDLTLQMRSIYWQSACVTPPVFLSSTGIALEQFHGVPSGHECRSGHFDPWRHQLWPRSSTTSTGFSATPLTGYFLRLDPAPTDCTGLPACRLAGCSCRQLHATGMTFPRPMLFANLRWFPIFCLVDGKSPPLYCRQFFW